MVIWISKNLFVYLYSYLKRRLGVGIGRQDRLKICFAESECGFDSRLRHGRKNQSWGISLVGRALDLHSKGQEFDSLILHIGPIAHSVRANDS